MSGGTVVVGGDGDGGGDGWGGAGGTAMGSLPPRDPAYHGSRPNFWSKSIFFQTMRIHPVKGKHYECRVSMYAQRCE